MHNLWLNIDWQVWVILHKTFFSLLAFQWALDDPVSPLVGLLMYEYLTQYYIIFQSTAPTLTIERYPIYGKTRIQIGSAAKFARAI